MFILWTKQKEANAGSWTLTPQRGKSVPHDLSPEKGFQASVPKILQNQCIPWMNSKHMEVQGEATSMGSSCQRCGITWKEFSQMKPYRGSADHPKMAVYGLGSSRPFDSIRKPSPRRSTVRSPHLKGRSCPVAGESMEPSWSVTRRDNRAQMVQYWENL